MTRKKYFEDSILFCALLIFSPRMDLTFDIKIILIISMGLALISSMALVVLSAKRLNYLGFSPIWSLIMAVGGANVFDYGGSLTLFLPIMFWIFLMVKDKQHIEIIDYDHE